MSALHKNLIGGEWVEGVAISRNVNPSDTNDVVGEYAQGDAAQTDAAIRAAHSALVAWTRTTAQERHDILLRVSTESSRGATSWRAFSPEKRARRFWTRPTKSAEQDRSSTSLLARR